ncbi:MAG: L-cysteine/cystine lyase [Chloroflexota bacterium]|nr:L-cysteine/cystine lyase [Chloroflexota bacterium]
MTPFLPDSEKLAAVREALPATAAGIYLNAGSVGPLPSEVQRAMAEVAERQARVGRATEDDHLELLERMDEARAAVAAAIVAAPGSIALTHSATGALNIAGWAIDWRAGDRVVTTGSEYIAALGPLSTIGDRFGVELVQAEIGADDEATLKSLDRAITPATRLVVISHVTWTTGTRLPIARIAELAHDRGALLAVDGAQAVGAIPVDVGALAVDFYALCAQKWLLGPEGMGALYVAPTALEHARRTFAGELSYASWDPAAAPRVQPDARRFEIAGYHPPSVVGMARSVAWLSMYVGLEWVHRRGATLAAVAAARLAAIPGVHLLTPTERMATLVTFRIEGWPAAAAFEEISRRSFAIFRTIPALDALRISVGFYTTEDELERFAATVALVAGHTPDSIPPRRTLAILGQDT